MVRERLYRLEAIVLRRADLGEADRLLTVYTPFEGKLRLLAKGVRKPTSRKAGHLEPFTLSRLLVARGRSLDLINQAETIEPFLPLRGDLMRTSYAYYFAELVDRFSEEEIENPPLFSLLFKALRWLGESEDPAWLARYFEIRLLDCVGYRPELHRCLHCRRGIGEGALFDPAQGGIICPSCSRGEGGQPLSPEALQHLRLLQSEDYALCQALAPSPPIQAELEATLGRYISYLLERRPRSLDFIATLRREEEKTLVL